MVTLEQIKQKIAKLGTGTLMDGSSADEGKTYHTIPIKGLETLPKHTSACSGELKAIWKNISFTQKKILEIGCANGFFSFFMSNVGGNVTAYEHDPKVHEINEMVKEYSPTSPGTVEFINKGFGLSDSVSMKEYDIVLMLNVHVWIDKQIGKENTVLMMRNIAKKCNKIYFQTSHDESSGSIRKVAYLKNDVDLTAYLVICGFKNIKEIYRGYKHGDLRIMYEASGEFENQRRIR